MPDIVCIIAASLSKESYELRVVRGEVEAILGVEQRACFAEDRLVCAKSVVSGRDG